MEFHRRVYMESNRNTDGVTEHYVVALRDKEHSHTRRHRNDETRELVDLQ